MIPNNPDVGCFEDFNIVITSRLITSAIALTGFGWFSIVIGGVKLFLMTSGSVCVCSIIVCLMSQVYAFLS